MLANIAFCLASLHQTAITFPAGYYTLAEIGESLTKQHVPVIVATACAHDVYVVRLSDTTWEKAMAAFQRDERLSITKHGDSWQIERSDLSKRNEARARERYVSYVLNTTHEFFSSVARKCAELETRTPDERHAAVEAARADQGNIVAKQDYAQLLYLFSDEHDFMFETLTVPAQLTDPAGSGFDKVVSTNFFDARFLILPDGDLDKFPLMPKNLLSSGDKERWARSLGIALKLPWDPVTLAVGSRTVFYQAESLGQGGASNVAEEVIPRRLRLSILPASVWSPDEIASIEERVKKNAPLIANETLAKTFTGPEKPMRLSEALLHSADASGTNLVAYVSPMTDYVLVSASSRSIAESVADANSERVDPGARMQELIERVGIRREEMKQALHPPSSFTITFEEGIVVVRNEMRFLDGFCDSRGLLPATFSNVLYRNQKASFLDLAKSIAASGPPTFFASNELDFCNPVSFYPFAAAITASADFRKLLTGLALNSKTTVEVAKLVSVTQNALLNGIGKCGPLNDASPGLNEDPMLVPARIAEVGPEKLSLELIRSPTSFTFTLLQGNTRLWQSQLLNVETSHP